jgi:hypothetical protein
MKVNRDVQQSTFQKGLALDPSDIVLPNDTLRYAQNLRIYNHAGSAFVGVNLQGTEQSFSLTSGFIPVAAQEFAGVLYIISWHTDGRLELGSYPSPNYANPSNPSDNPLVYRPLNNFDGGPFRTDELGTASKPVIQKLEIQPDYDESVNMCFTIVGGRPRIVNTKFKAENNGTVFSILEDRSATSSAAASNTYDSASVDKETSLILFSQKILKISLQSISGGGKLKPGNYQYVFYYMTEDFNRTSVIGQSSTCQVSFGETVSSIRGGDESEETNKKVNFILSNIDTDFRYIKMYVMYSSGQDGLQQQYLEVVRPIEITGEIMNVYHTGFEELNEVSQDEVNVDYAMIDSAAASTQVGGYYFLGDVKQRLIQFDYLRTAVGSISPLFMERSMNISSLGLPGYCDPLNVYNYLGYMGRETYPFGVVFVMNDGSLCPVFPTKSVSFDPSGAVVSVLPADEQKGLVTFPFSNLNPYYDEVNTSIKAKYLQFDVTTLKDNTSIRENTIGFFFVRGERRPNAITQGILVPTIKAPTVEAPDGDFSTNTGVDTIDAGGYYVKNGDDRDDLNVFKHLINLDSILEAFLLNQDTTDFSVIDGNGGLTPTGYLPVYMRHNTANYGLDGNPVTVNVFMSKNADTNARHWALLSGDALLNEAEFITSLQREAMGLHQLGKINFKVLNQVTPANSISFGCHYDMLGYANLYTPTTLNKLKKIVYVPAESLATGTDFISKIKVALLASEAASSSAHYWINQWFNSYFGVQVDSTTDLTDSTISASNPIGGNLRSGKTDPGNVVDAHLGYNNYNKTVPAAFVVNIYPQNVILTADQLYETVDGITYKQIGPRYSWDDTSLVSTNYKVDVFGGDCYISKVSRKLSHAPVRDASLIQTDAAKRWNIDSGLIISWWQEAKYNLHLRQAKQYDVSELEKRSFFPYQSLGDPIAYRKYRLPETAAHSPGYSEVLPPKSFFGISPLTPYERTRFMNRIYHSEKHIPNAFKNGYRSFLETNFRDYDAGMGSIVAMFNHRGMLLVVFEHGIGITSIEQRVQTGADAAGAIFVEPSGVLPPTLTYYSREIGCQDVLSLVQTPGAVYGVDRSKDKIWMVRDSFKVISDETMASWLIQNPVVNPRSGYDFENNEVIFSTNNWALCFSEGLDTFSSFYTLTDAAYFARRNKELYSFIANTAYKHNSNSTYNIYGTPRETVLEVVINKSTSVAKVLDYLNIISNEVAPTKVEVYSYNQSVLVEPTIALSNLNQYTKVQYEVSPFTEEPTMLYRDKKYVVQIPYRQEYNVGSTEDKWGIEGRIRDKVLIVRITYQTDKALEVASILNYFRYSPS